MSKTAQIGFLNNIQSLIFAYKWQLFYYFLSSTIHFVQNCVLSLLGVFQRNVAKGCVVHVYRIFARTTVNFDVKCNDFISVYTRSVTFDYLLKDEVTLYTVDEKYVYFVETDPAVNIIDSDTNPFLMIAQNRKGKYVLKLLHHDFLQFSKRVENPSVFAICHHTARCGSTLLAQMMEMTGKITSISEPYAVNAAVENFQKKCSRELMVSLVKVDGKQRTNIQVGLFIKAWETLVTSISDIHKGLPRVKQLFIYRNGLPTVGSCSRSFLGVAGITYDTRPKTFKSLLKCKYVTKSFPRFKEHHNILIDHVTCWDTFWTWFWAGHIRGYLNAVDDNIPIKCVKYEDLITKPEETFSKILAYCGFPEELAKKGSGAIKRDSQRGTVVSQSAMDSTDPKNVFPAYGDPGIKAKCDAICDAMHVPRLNENIQLPNDISAD